MGDDTRMYSALWNGENEDGRRRTDPIEWSMHFMEFVSELLCESEILCQLLSDLFNNEQPLERLLK
jgi:hypothetical protein